MKINYDKRKMDVGGNELEAVEKKVLRLAKFFDDDAAADVRFSENRGKVTAEITARSNRMVFRAEEKAEDVLSATDGAVEALSRQIRKNKTRLEKRLRSGAFERAVAEAPAESDELVRRKQFELRPMSEQDALL